MLKGTQFTFGKLTGTIYDFAEAADVLEKHQHDEESNHITVVARGSFKISGNGWERVVRAGDVIDWRPFDPHEFTALEDNSRVVNIIKGCPAPSAGESKHEQAQALHATQELKVRS
jgi:hypothetical protein